mgnify:FL=1
MSLEKFFKAIIDSDNASVVICDKNHTIVYMNPAACKSYEKYGGEDLVSKSILDCHNEHSAAAIKTVAAAFEKNPKLNRVFTFHNEKQNKDVYMIALRDETGELLGYYEKHEYRNQETCERYKLD